MSDQSTHSAHPALEALFHGRVHDLGGGFTVARALPQTGCRAVGPVVFLDHMGPAEIPPGRGFDVRPHPHIGLATVTYLFEGEIVHRDSLGVHQAIRPGAVNLMVAGRGITHSERAGDEFRRDGGRVHGVQLWVALQRADEQCEPSFVHHPSDTLPSARVDGASVRVLLGEAFGLRSPAQVSARTLLAEVRVEPGASFALPDSVQDVAFLVIEGAVSLDAVVIEPRSLGVRAQGQRGVTLRAGGEGALVVLVGGDYLDGAYDRTPRLIEWNFVASSRALLDEARARWIARGFPTVPGDEHERIPFPGEE